MTVTYDEKTGEYDSKVTGVGKPTVEQAQMMIMVAFGAIADRMRRTFFNVTTVNNGTEWVQGNPNE